MFWFLGTAALRECIPSSSNSSTNHGRGNDSLGFPDINMGHVCVFVFVRICDGN